MTITWPPKGDVGTLLPPKVPRIKPGAVPVEEPEVIVVEPTIIVEPEPEPAVVSAYYTPPPQPDFAVPEVATVSIVDPVVSTSGSAILHPTEAKAPVREVFHEGYDPYVTMGDVVEELPEGTEIVTAPSVFSSLYNT